MQLPGSVFERLISKPRLNSYRAYWKANREAAVGIYMWNGELCAEVNKLLSLFEIALRNNIHREMSLAHTRGSSQSIPWWNGIAGQLSTSTQAAIFRTIDKLAPSPTPDEIVANFSFGFWPSILNWIAKNRTSVMRHILPAHPLSLAINGADWSHKQARSSVVGSILELKNVRNRIAHHEPLWKFPDIVDTSKSPPVISVAASTDEASTLSRMARILDLYDQLLGAISPTLRSHVHVSTWRRRIDFLLSERGLARYKCGLHIAEASPLTVQDFQEQFAGVVRRNRPVMLIDIGGEGTFFPT